MRQVYRSFRPAFWLSIALPLLIFPNACSSLNRAGARSNWFENTQDEFRYDESPLTRRMSATTQYKHEAQASG